MALHPIHSQQPVLSNACGMGVPPVNCKSQNQNTGETPVPQRSKDEFERHLADPRITGAGYYSKIRIDRTEMRWDQKQVFVWHTFSYQALNLAAPPVRRGAAGRLRISAWTCFPSGCPIIPIQPSWKQCIFLISGKLQIVIYARQRPNCKYFD
jgi:hypothetical protein